MTRAYVVVESQSDADFLRKVLPPDALHDVELQSVGHGTRMLSRARTLLVRHHLPVAVFRNAYSLNANLNDENQMAAQELVQMAAGSAPGKVFLAIPELASSLFSAPELIERVLGQPVPAEFIALGKRDPSGVLNLLAEKANQPWDFQRALQMMDANDIDHIRETAAIQQLTAFLRNPREKARANGLVNASA